MPRNRSCGSYGPGHLTHWIQAKKSHEDGAKEMRVYAEIAEGSAIEAIDFAEAAIYEAEYAVLDALSARAAATTMAS